MLTERFDAALIFASDLHRNQTRKGTSVPYVSHLMSVAALVLEHGGSENQAIAALLHDAVEDQGGLATARLIADRFGANVTQLVLACTDALPTPGEAKSPWIQRKAAYIERTAEIPPAAALVVTCDKLHNLACLIADVRRDGPSSLDRFERPGSLAWYYSALAEALAPHARVAPVHELRAKAREFSDLVAPYDLPRGDARH